MFNYEPADIVIYRKDQGAVLKEKSLVAFEEKTSKILAVGTEAERYAGRETEGIKVISPLRQGMVADYQATVCMFQNMLRRAWGKKLLLKPPIAVCMSKHFTEVEKKAVIDAVYQAGAKEIFLSDVPYVQLKEYAQLKENGSGKVLAKFHTIIDITKDEPELYFRELMVHAVEYASAAGISAERIQELWTENTRTS